MSQHLKLKETNFHTGVSDYLSLGNKTRLIC